MVKQQKSDIQMAYEYIWVTYGWHASKYEWNTGDIRVTYEYVYEWHTDDIRVHTRDIPVYTITYEWYAADIQVHTSDLPMTYKYRQIIHEYIRVTYERHMSGLRVHTIGIRNIKTYKGFGAFRS